MSEQKVVIKSSGKTLEDALSDGIAVDNMASEETLKEILTEIKKYIKTVKGMSSINGQKAEKGSRKDEDRDTRSKGRDDEEVKSGILKATAQESADLRKILEDESKKNPARVNRIMQDYSKASDPRPILQMLLKHFKEIGNKSGEAKIKEMLDHKQALLGYDKRFHAILSYFPKALHGPIKAISGVFSDFKKGGVSGAIDSIVTRLPPQFAAVGLAISGVVGIISVGVKKLLEWNRTLFQSADVGASFNNNLMEMRVAAARSGLSLSEFTSIVTKNSALIAEFGGTVTTGALAFSNLSNRVLKEYGTELAQMGIKMSQVNEMLPIYMNIMRQGALTGSTSVEKQAESFKRLVVETDLMAKLTGKSREAVLKDVQKKQNDAAFQLKLSKMSVEEREKVTRTMIRMQAQFGDMGGDFVKLRFLGLVPMTEELQLASSTMPGFYDAVNQATDAAMNNKVGMKEHSKALDQATVDAVVSAMTAAEGMESVLAAGGAGLGGSASALAKIYQDVVSMNGKYLKDGKISAELVEKSIKQAKEEQVMHDLVKDGLDEVTRELKVLGATIFESVIKPLYTALGPAFLVVSKILVDGIKILGWFFKTIGYFLAPLGFIGTMINKAIQDIKTKIEPAITSISNFIKSLKNAFSDFLDSIGLSDKFWEGFHLVNATLILIGIGFVLFKGALFGIVGALKTVTTGILGIAGKLLSKIPGVGKLFGGAGSSSTSAGGIADAAGKGAGGIANAGKGLGSAISSIGSGIGNIIKSIGSSVGRAIGGILKSLSSGVASFGTPKVLFGIANIGLLGLSIIPLSYALKQFTNIDWTNVMLGGVALGALAVAAGIMGIPAFAIPIAIGAGVIGLLGTALIPFAYAANLAAPAMDQIFTSMMKVKDISITTLMGLGPAMFGIAAGLTAMTAGGLISNLVDGFGKLFGAKSPFEKLTDLGNTAPGIAAVATNLGLIKELLNTMPSGENLGGIVASINSIDTAKLMLLTASNLVSQAKNKNQEPTGDSLPVVLNNLATVLNKMVSDNQTGASGGEISDKSAQFVVLLERIDRTLQDIKSINEDGFENL